MESQKSTLDAFGILLVACLVIYSWALLFVLVQLLSIFLEED